jgi:acyl-CoA synthetase (NDP forming)
MTDLAVTFYFLPPINGTRIGIVGGGGGKGSLSADECEEAGFDVIPLPREVREEIGSKMPQISDWIGNPADGSIGDVMVFDSGDIAQIMAKNSNFDLLLVSIPEGAPMGKEQVVSFLRSQVDGYIKVSVDMGKPVVAVIREKSLGIENYNDWRWKLIAELRTKLIAANVPVYSTAHRAAKAVKRMIDYNRSNSHSG